MQEMGSNPALSALSFHTPTHSVLMNNILADYVLMGLDKSKLIHRWHCDASQALEVAYRRLFTLSHTAWNDYDRFIKLLTETLSISYASY